MKAIYQYICKECNHNFEKEYEQYRAARSPKCPQCGNRKTERSYYNTEVHYPRNDMDFHTSKSRMRKLFRLE